MHLKRNKYNSLSYYDVIINRKNTLAATGAHIIILFPPLYLLLYRALASCSLFSNWSYLFFIVVVKIVVCVFFAAHLRSFSLSLFLMRLTVFGLTSHVHCAGTRVTHKTINEHCFFVLPLNSNITSIIHIHIYYMYVCLSLFLRLHSGTTPA